MAGEKKKQKNKKKGREKMPDLLTEVTYSFIITSGGT